MGKLPRVHVPTGKGIMGSYLRLAARAAFRTGYATYCGYSRNAVQAGSWVGGIIGLKSILGIRDERKALTVLDALCNMGYITYTLDPRTKKLTYTILDWVSECSGAVCMQGTVYTTERYGFLCIPRKITERLVKTGHRFEEADAWLDIWCHSIWGDRHNVFSRLYPTIQFSRQSLVLTFEKIWERWGDRSKTWRFFCKYRNTFILHKLPGSYGYIIFKYLYPTATLIRMPTDATIERKVDTIRIMGRKTYCSGKDHGRINKMVLWYSSQIPIGNLNVSTPSPYHPNEKVALQFRTHIIRARIFFPNVVSTKERLHERISMGEGFRLPICTM